MGGVDNEVAGSRELLPVGGVDNEVAELLLVGGVDNEVAGSREYCQWVE